MMAKYIGLDKFKAIYVVDLCHSLCEVAKAKAKAKGWKNVHVVEADACTFEPKEGSATLVTFSYSLTSEFMMYVHLTLNRLGRMISLPLINTSPKGGQPESPSAGHAPFGFARLYQMLTHSCPVCPLLQ